MSRENEPSIDLSMRMGRIQGHARSRTTNSVQALTPGNDPIHRLNKRNNLTAADRIHRDLLRSQHVCTKRTD